MKTNVNRSSYRSKIPAVLLVAMVLLAGGCSSPGTSRYFSQNSPPDSPASIDARSNTRAAGYGQFASVPMQPDAAENGWRIEGAGRVVRGQQADRRYPQDTLQNRAVPSIIPDSELDLGLGSGTVLNDRSSWGEPYDEMNTVDLNVVLNEARTGRFSIGMGVNSDAGVSGQIIVDERNFDWTAFPSSFEDIANGQAFRGGGQGFRLEALPGSQFQRYLLSFSEPYLWGTPISFSLSGYFFDRRYDDWDEERLGGRFAFGYRLTPDLSATMALRMENVTIHNPRVGPGVQELDEVLGDNSLFSAQFTLSHDTRDIPFAPTEGHFLELSFTQAFGTFDFPRAELDYRLYFLLRERPDGSGRHTLAYSFRTGFSGGNTPLFENYYAGGYSTLRGFDFRGASPQNGGVTVGGEFRFLGSAEYFFPLTADDMIKGVVFCDFGTVEEKIAIHANDYRVAPGIGLRLAIPAMGPAPIALDFAIPIAKESTDRRRSFSFFFGYTRGG